MKFPEDPGVYTDSFGIHWKSSLDEALPKLRRVRPLSRALSIVDMVVADIYHKRLWEGGFELRVRLSGWWRTLPRLALLKEVVEFV